MRTEDGGKDGEKSRKNIMHVSSNKWMAGKKRVSEDEPFFLFSFCWM